jgi:hypothetical protein
VEFDASTGRAEERKIRPPRKIEKDLAARGTAFVPNYG